LALQALYFEPADEGRTIRAEPIPEDLVPVARAWRERLFDALTERDERDQITTALLEGQDIPLEKVRAVIFASRRWPPHPADPVRSGREHIGIQPLAGRGDVLSTQPPGPPPVEGHNPKNPEKVEKRKPDPREPFCGLVFKIVASTHGELYYVRIYSGILKTQSRLFKPRSERQGTGGQDLPHHGRPARARGPGRGLPRRHRGADRVKESITGDTLCETQHPILLERIVFAQSVVSMSIEPESTPTGRS